MYLSLSGSLNIGLLFFFNKSGLIGFSDLVVSEAIDDSALSNPSDDLLFDRLVENCDSIFIFQVASGLPPFTSLLYCRRSLRFCSFSALICIVNYL